MRHIRQVAISAFLCTMVSGWALAQSPNPERTGYIPELKELKVAVAQGNAPAGGRGAAPARGTQPAQRGGPAASTPVYANLAQLMRGILYPNSNVIFFVQDKDPAGIKAEGDPATAVNPLASTYGGWEAVQNSALALSEAANLLLIPGRKCANGRSVPLQIRIGRSSFKVCVMLE